MNSANKCIHLTFFRAVPLRSTLLQKAGDANRYSPEVHSCSLANEPVASIE